MAKDEIVLTYDEYNQFTDERNYAMQAEMFGLPQRESPITDRVNEVMDANSPYIFITPDREAETMTLRDMA